MAVWASSRLSVRVARPSSSKEVKSVMAARTGSGRHRNHRAKRTSMLVEAPATSGGRQHRDLILVRASDGRWSPSGWLDKSRIIWTLFSVDGENFFKINSLRSFTRLHCRPLHRARRTFVGTACLGWQ